MEFFRDLMHEFDLPLTNPVLIFSLILFIILLSPILLRRFNIPGIIVLILAGVIIGPYGLNILRNSSAVNLFSTIGLLYIMFIAGLELDMQEFKSYRNRSLVFGFFTFIFPLGIGFPVCFYLLGYDFNASFLTAGMFATHTLVAYPIVSKLGVSKNQAVAITVGGTVLTDTAVLIILAIIMGNVQGNLNQEFWIRLTISILIFSVIMFIIIPRVTKWFFRKMESEKHSHYIFVLSIVFLAAFLAEVAGLEPIIGAFAAGLALNRLIPHSSALMNRIEFIGNSLFIPFFLISVGMLVDIRVILRGPMALIVAGTLIIVALLGKWIAAFFTQIIFKYSNVQRQLIFGLSTSHAAATLAIILVGYHANILDENILNGTIILILVTCIVASFATEKAAKKIIVESEEEKNDLVRTNGSLSERILLPISNVANIEKLLELTTFIKDKKSTYPISILSVVSNDNEGELNLMKARNMMEGFVKQASASEININIITTLDHNAASGISRISKEIMADIIVLGWPQRTAFIDKFIGEKIDNILTNTNKTTFICHLEKPLFMHKRIVIAAPPLVEYENGFGLWFSKMIQLAHELSISIQLYCNDATRKAVGKLFRKIKFTASINLHLFTEWEDFLILARNIDDDDLVVVVSARKGATSYMGLLEKIPSKLETYFPNNSLLIIYPKQYEDGVISKQYFDLLDQPSNKGLETLDGNTVTQFLKTDDNSFYEDQIQRRLLPWLLVLIIWVLSIWHIFNNGIIKDHLIADILTLIVLPLIITVSLYLFKLSIKVNQDYLMFKMFPFHFNYKKIKLNEIISANIKEYNVDRSFHGWGLGISWKRNNKSYTVKGYKGVEIKLKNGKILFLGTQRPEELISECKLR